MVAPLHGALHGALHEDSLRALVPALALALFALFAGTVPGGATAFGAIAGHLALLGLAAAALDRWSNPLEQGVPGRATLAIVVVLALVSLASSPVPRAGRTGLAVAALLLFLPATVARCWRTPTARRRGAAAVAVVAAAVALWALADRYFLGSPRAAMPLGHHLPMAAWLVVTLPLGLAVGARHRAPALLLAGVGGTALLATGSRSGLLAAAAQVLAVVVGRVREGERAGRLPTFAVVGGVVGSLVAGVAGVAAVAALSGAGDPSVAARWGYLRAAAAGIAERPLLGWGPGSVPWTLAPFLRPQAGLNPPGEAVGDLHSLPVHLAWELGLPAVVALAFVGLATLRRSRGSEDSLSRAGRLSIVGALVMSAGCAPVAIVALPVALAVAVGATLPSTPRGSSGRAPGVAVWLVALAVLAPSDLAQSLWDAAREAPDGGARQLLGRASALDPDFPLYRARRAWLSDRPSATAADEALRAARDGVGIASLRWMAGILGFEARRPWAAGELEEAWRMDPLVALGPYLLSESSRPDAHLWGARAVLVEPILGGSLAWRSRPGFVTRVGEALRSWPGLDPSIAAALASAVEAPTGATDSRDLVFGLDGRPATAVTLHLFRRSPWAADLLRVPVASGPVERLAGVPSAPDLALLEGPVAPPPPRQGAARKIP